MEMMMNKSLYEKLVAASEYFKPTLEIGQKIINTDTNCLMEWNGEDWIVIKYYGDEDD